jgi:adenine/guanine phosphoribosyltransferase-like PRPP-binding protein
MTQLNEVDSNIKGYLSEICWSTTSNNPKTLLLDMRDAKPIREKKIGLIDDVTASFSTLNMTSRLVQKAIGRVTQSTVVMIEGIREVSIIHKGRLPFQEDALQNTKQTITAQMKTA